MLFGSNIDKPIILLTFDDILIDIFNPKFGFVHILHKIGPAFFRVHSLCPKKKKTYYHGSLIP